MIESVVNTVNTAIEVISIENQEILGLAKIHDLESQKYPAIWLGESWNMIALDESYGLTAYHRVIDISGDEDDDFDFRGTLSVSVKDVYNMVLVLAMNKDNDYDKALEIKNLIPAKIALGGYNAVYIQVDEIETDQDSIINDEWGSVDYTKHKSNFNIFKINYTVDLINC